MTDPRTAAVPAPIHATAADLPPPVAETLAHPPDPRTFGIDAAGIRWHAFEWGRPADPPLLIVHGVGSSGRTWWRIGPALAAAGYRVVAPDLPGHGRTGTWLGHHRFADNAADLAEFARAAGIASGDRIGPVVGHSWGAMTAAALPAAGLRPERIVLIDPPTVELEVIALMADDPTERAYPSLDESLAAVRAAYPAWSDGDLHAKAEELTLVDVTAVRRVLLENGDWDGGLGSLSDPRAAGVPVWLIRGVPEEGGYVPDDRVAAFKARIGADRCLTIGGAPHSPHRLFPEATLMAVLRALA